MVNSISELTDYVCTSSPEQPWRRIRFAPIPPEHPELPSAVLKPDPGRLVMERDVVHEMMWLLAGDPGSFRWSLTEDHVTMSSLDAPLHLDGILPPSRKPSGFNFPGPLSYYSIHASRDPTTTTPPGDPVALASSALARSPLIAVSTQECSDNKRRGDKSTVLIVPVDSMIV